MRNLPEREQLEKWSQQWEQIKQLMVLESQIERAKEIMGAKAALPSDVQSIKHEDHAGLTKDDQTRIEAVANEKGSDSESSMRTMASQARKQVVPPGTGTVSRTTEADVGAETGHATMSLLQA